MAQAAEAALSRETSEQSSQPEEELSVDPERFPLERYAPLEILGSGMAGTVYLCNDRLLRKKVAIKLLTTLTPEQLVAFQGEARAASKLNHPNIVKVLDFGVTTGGIPFMVMESVQGTDLAGIIEQEKTISVTAALYIFGKVCDGLAEAHKQGIFHRDIKNSNILVGALESHKPDVRLIDFGVSTFRPAADSQTAQGATLVGTPAYMSPDQALGKPYDVRCEIYSLGCALFEALTGSPPFSGETALEIIKKHAHEKPPRLSDENPGVDFSEQLENVLAVCLEKRPEARFQSMEELSRALDSVVSNELADASPRREPEIAKPAVAPQKGTVKNAAVIYSLLALVGVAGLIWIIASQLDSSTPSNSTATKTADENEKKLEGGELLAPVLPLDADHFVRRDYNGIKYFISSGSLKDIDIKELAGQKDVDGVYILSENVTGEGLDALASVDLKNLDVNNTPLSEKGFEAISKIKSLKNLALGDLDISESQMELITKIPGLEKLDLANSRPSEAAIAQIGMFPKLETLILSNVQTTKPADLAKLAGTTGLKELNLGYIKFGSQDLAPIQSLKGLNKISFVGADIDDRALQHIVNLPLITVALDRTNVTPGGLQLLANVQSLKHLSVRDCRKLDSEAIVELQQALPDCKIIQ